MDCGSAATALPPAAPRGRLEILTPPQKENPPFRVPHPFPLKKGAFLPSPHNLSPSPSQSHPNATTESVRIARK
jgi:hypothetical protein